MLSANLIKNPTLFEFQSQKNVNALLSSIDNEANTSSSDKVYSLKNI